MACKPLGLMQTHMSCVQQCNDLPECTCPALPAVLHHHSAAGLDKPLSNNRQLLNTAGLNTEANTWIQTTTATGSVSSQCTNMSCGYSAKCCHCSEAMPLYTQVQVEVDQCF